MSKENEKNAYRQLLEGIESYVAKVVADNTGDITATAQIVSIQSDGSYTIRLNDVEYQNIDTIGGTCVVNEMVHVLIPQGQYNNMFILKGGSGSGRTVSGVTSVNGKTGSVTLTADDVGALPNTTVIPTKTSQLQNDSNFVVDVNYVHTDNNFTTTLKDKLNGIASGAEVNIQSDWNVTDTISDAYIKNKPTIPTKTSQLENDSDYVVDKNYVHTDNNYTTADKNKLSGIEDGAQKNTVTGIKGNTESSYRTGNVNITKANIGLGNVDNVKQWSDNNHPTTLDGYGITDGASSTDLSNLEKRVKTNEDNIGTIDTEVDTLQTNVQEIQNNYVPKSRKVNGKTLDQDITLSKSDVGLGNVPNVTTNNQTPTFTQASSRVNIKSGETLSVLFGKIMKWFADLKTIAFTGSYKDLSDTPNFLTGGSQTTTSTADGGNNVFTFTKADGSEATFTVKNGSKGSSGKDGTNGVRGNTWRVGTVLTHAGDTATTTEFTSADTIIGDMYLNTQWQFVYQCIAVTSTNSTWEYLCSIKGGTLAWNSRNVNVASTEQVAKSEVDGRENVYRFTLFDGSTSDLVVRNGTGVTIKTTSINYQASTSGTTIPTGTWSASVPSVTKGQYLWSRTIVSYSDGKSTTTYNVAYQGKDGTNGTNGTTPTIKAASGSDIGSVGTPSVTASTSGTTTTFTFHNLKGEKGENATTTAVATTSVNGLMSASDKTKLDVTNVVFGTCSTAAATAAKTVTITGNSNWKLTTGAIAFVKFTTTNTASNCTLNVNGTGAKSIWYNNAKYTGNSNLVCGYANRYIIFGYDGTYWVWLGFSAENNTWTAFKGATATANGTAGYVPTPTAGNQNKFFRADGTWATLALAWNE